MSYIKAVEAARTYYTEQRILETEPPESWHSMLLSHKVFLGLAIWTMASVIVSIAGGVEVLLTLELIGLLVTRELTDGFLTKSLKDKLDYFIYLGLFLFAVVVVRRVWLILD